MPVIGTAGHVDHGKTALIEALTGTNPDRLPEEKARGMTIDLGFAFFNDDEGRPIGVIDVPGHERFIRNMVAGAAGIDAALLVVAADDGWMEQTERHTHVLNALGVPIVAIALTKIDAVPRARIDEISVDVTLRAEAAFGRSLPLVPVSAKAGTNIESLRRTILESLVSLSSRKAAAGRAESAAGAWLSVDRVFTLKGTGLVVAGSLAGGSLERGDELILQPGREAVRVRSMQSYGRDVVSAGAGVRVALNLPRPKRDIERGDCLTSPGSPVRSGLELVCRAIALRGSDPVAGRERSLRNCIELEVAAGTARRIAELRTMKAPGFFRLVLDAAMPCRPGQRLVLIRRGGADILGAATILDVGTWSPVERRRIQAACATLPSREADDDPELFAAALRSSEKKAVCNDVKDDSEKPAEKKGKVEFRSESFLAAYKRIEDAGKFGLERAATLDPKLKREIGPLCDAGLVLPLDTELFLAAKVYRDLVGLVLEGRKLGERFGVPEAKAATGYSRKYALPFLNRMERDGWVRRDGDWRVVLRIPD